jgi:hypothetical protein
LDERPGGAFTSIDITNFHQEYGIGVTAIPLLLNERRRSIKCLGVFGARVSAGTIRKESIGVGDTIMADPRNGFFGVADSSERNPAFGREFMNFFSAFISGFELLLSRLVDEEQSIRFLRECILVRSEILLGTLPFRGSCAFTGLSLVRTRQGLGAMLFHSGDTMLFRSDSGRGISLVTKSNFWFVGKSSRFFQTAFLKVEPGTRFLLATDGFHGLSPISGKETILLAEELFRTNSVENVPDALFDLCCLTRTGMDEVALLTLDPNRPLPDMNSILLGGTTWASECERRGREEGMSDVYEPWNPGGQLTANRRE